MKTTNCLPLLQPVEVTLEEGKQYGVIVGRMLVPPYSYDVMIFPDRQIIHYVSVATKVVEASLPDAVREYLENRRLMRYWR